MLIYIYIKHTYTYKLNMTLAVLYLVEKTRMSVWQDRIQLITDDYMFSKMATINFIILLLDYDHILCTK